MLIMKLNSNTKIILFLLIIFSSIGVNAQFKQSGIIKLDNQGYEIKKTWHLPKINCLLINLEKGYFEGKIELVDIDNGKVIFSHPSGFYYKSYNKEYDYEMNEYASINDIHGVEVDAKLSEILVRTNERSFLFSISGDSLLSTKSYKPLKSDDEQYDYDLDINVKFDKKLKAYTLDGGNRIFVENTKKKEIFGISKDPYAGYKMLSFSPDGSLLVAFYGNYSDIVGIVTIDPIGGELIDHSEFEFTEQPELYWLANESFFCVSKGSNELIFYTWSSSQEVESEFSTIVQNGHLSAILDIDIQKDRNLIASLDEQGKVIIWDIKTGLLISSFSPKEKPTNVEFLDESKLIVSGLSSATVYNYFDAKIISHHKVEYAVVDPDNKDVIYGRMNTSKSYGYDYKIVKYSIADQKIIDVLPNLNSDNNNIWEFMAMPNENGLLWLDWQSNLYLQSGNSKWKKLADAEFLGGERFDSYTVSPDDRYLALGGRSGNLVIYEIGTWDVVGNFQTNKGWLKALSFNHDCNSIISSSQFGEITVWDWRNKKSEYVFTHEDIIPNWLLRNVTYNSSYNNIKALDISSEYLVSASDRSTLKIWDGKSYELLKTLESQTIPISDTEFNGDDIFVSSALDYALGSADIFPDTLIRSFSFVSKIQIDTISQHYNWVNNLGLSHDGKWMVSSDNNNAIAVRNLITKDTVISWFRYDGLIDDIQISPDGNYIAWTEGPSEQVIYILRNGDSESTKQIKNKDLNKAIHLTNSNLYYSIKDKYYSYSLHKNKSKVIFDAKESDESHLLYSLQYDSLRDNLMFSDGTSFYVVSLVDDSVIYDSYTSSHNPDFLTFMPESNTAITASGKLSMSGNSVMAHDLNGIKKKWINKDFKSPISSIKANDDSLVMVSCKNGEVIFLNANTGQKIATMVFAKNTKDFIIFTPDQYYYSSKKGTKLVGYLYGEKILTFEQLDLQFNRPDIVLSRIGLTDNQVIENFILARNKRLKKMGFNENDLASDVEFPVIEIRNKNQIPLQTNSSEILLELKMSSDQSDLDRLNIWVNDVPINGVNGIDFGNLNKKEILRKLNIPLSAGPNKIQVSCHNALGVESFRETFMIEYKPLQQLDPDLYIVVLSVSNYHQNEYNLKYAVKDGRDLVSLYAEKQVNNYKHIHVDTLFNSDATLYNVLAIKQKLQKSKVDDHVILYVSGHGLLDDNLDFYFASHDMDFSDPALRGISYETLEDLLDSIPARKKLFMMDACHSGEVDKEELVEDITPDDLLAQNNKDKKNGLKTYSYRGAKATTSSNTSNKLGLQNSFELMQELFTNLNRGSGAMVISAAGGDSYALESQEWNNGVFTYAVINGLKNNKADADSDGEVSVSELRSYVIEQVQELTNGRQKPTSRQENIEFDFRVW